MPRAERVKIEIEVTPQVLRLLSVLGEPKDVIEKLIDHAQQGVYRPGSWERPWLGQAFGCGFEDQLETDPECRVFQRPKGK